MVEVSGGGEVHVVGRVPPRPRQVGASRRAGERRRVWLTLVLVVLAAVACTPGVGLDALRAEPVLDPPGSASELARGERSPEGGLFLGTTSGYVQVVHASPDEPDAVVEHYLREHDARYGFAVNDRTLSASGSGTATVLNGARDEVRVAVRVDTAAPSGPDALDVPDPPDDTVTIVTVMVQSP